MDTCRRDDWNIRIHNTQQIADRNIQSFDSAKKTQTSALRKTPGICLSGKSSGVISSFYRFQLIDCIRFSRPLLFTVPLCMSPRKPPATAASA